MWTFGECYRIHSAVAVHLRSLQQFCQCSCISPVSSCKSPLHHTLTLVSESIVISILRRKICIFFCFVCFLWGGECRGHISWPWIFSRTAYAAHWVSHCVYLVLSVGGCWHPRTGRCSRSQGRGAHIFCVLIFLWSHSSRFFPPFFGLTLWGQSHVIPPCTLWEQQQPLPANFAISN